MASTRTGNYPIGFRRGWSEWQRDIAGLTAWAKENDVGVLDLGTDLSHVVAATEAGLKIGSVDLLAWGALFSKDPGKRAESIAQNSEYITATAAYGAKNYFLVILPEDPALPRKENFEYAVDGLSGLVPALEKAGGRVVIEGYPGAGALACTPEGYRALFAAIPSPTIGVNYDPSHLLRMGICPYRFLHEFGSRVGHVHGKDTEIRLDRLYDLGTEQPATFAKGFGFGGTFWRYTIPGQGNTNWGQIFRLLESAEYAGAVSIELEDENYNGSEVGEKRGLLAGQAFLSEA